MRKIPKHYIRPVPLPRPERAAAGDGGHYGRPLSNRRLDIAESNENGPWDRLGTALLLAGGAYPLLLWVVALATGAFVMVVSLLQNDWEPLVYAPLFVALSLLAALFGGCFTLFYTGVVTVFALLAVAGVVRLLRLTPGWETLGAFCGSWVAFLCFLPLTYAGKLRPADALDAWPVLACGPGLGITWGMLVGAYTGIGNQRRSLRGPAGAARLRFSIRQMMLLTLIVSLLLALLRLAQMLNSTLLFSVGIWLSCYGVFYPPATRLARWLYLRRARRYLKRRSKWRVLSRDGVSMRDVGKLVEATAESGRL